MADFANVLVEKADGIGTITLNRPQELNPLDYDMVNDLHGALDALEADPAVELIVLRGAGRAFSAGGDLKKAVASHQDQNWMLQIGNRLRGLLERLEASSRVVIAVVEGLCVAGGIELILACDYVLASAEAKFSDGHLNFSLLPGAGGTQRMPRLIGKLRAMDLLLTARFINGAQAAELGLVTRAVPAADLASALAALTANLLEKSFSSRKAIKYLVNQGLNGPLPQGLHLEAAYVLNYETTHPDAHEGLVAFMEKRKPNFRGGGTQ